MYKANAFINGNSIEGEDTKTIFDTNNEILGTIPLLTEQQIKDAFDSASLSFEYWKNLNYKERSKIILCFSEKLLSSKKLLSSILSREVGKTIEEANDEIIRSVDYIVETVDCCADIHERPMEFSASTHLSMPKNLHATFLRQPHGVVLTISPFNYPVNLMINKIIPALLMGNTVVHKSSSQGSICGWYIAKIFHEITIDDQLVCPGVFNFITGQGSLIGKYLLNDKIAAVSFTGSSKVGSSISKALSLIPHQMELGGLNTAIVLKDADLALTAHILAKSAYSFGGQRCTALKRALVHESVLSKLIKLLLQEIQKTTIYSLMGSNIIEETKSFVEDAFSKSARLVTGELKIEGKAVHPILLSGVQDNMSVFHEELFAPILSISAFDDIEDAIKTHNNSKYGLQASVFSTTLDTMSSIAMDLDVNRVNLNRAPSRSPDILPFGGIKKSGVGTEGVKDSLMFFSRYKGVISEDMTLKTE